MTQGEVINKLSIEMALALGDLDTLQTCRTYIQMALMIGIEHFTKDMEEIIVLTKNGEEVTRLKSVTEGELKLGIRQACISDCLAGRQHTAGGYMFIKAKDKELIPAKKTA